MGATGEPSRYYPMDSNGLMVQSELPMACVCQVALVPMVCPPLGYGNCLRSECANTYGVSCFPGTCNNPGSPTPCSPPLPNPNDRVIVPLGFVGLIIACWSNPICRTVLLCLAGAIGVGLGELVNQLIQGTCCNWCSIGCASICGCLAGVATAGLAGLLGRLLPPPLGGLLAGIIGAIGFGACNGCCVRWLRC